ncbi:MAG: hypothetical protein OIN87_01515 [Candidatus Methanoperedens sp.]|nr:hypothetical protein [Candidatus Methanoperedens sp.]
MNLKRILDRWVILSITIIILLIILNIPFVTVESFKEKEFYTEQEPYTTTVTYFEKESYIENVPIILNSTVDWHISDRRYKDEFDFIATLKNIDNARGEFWVRFHLESTNGSNDFTTESVFLMPGESHQFKESFTGIFSYVTYRVIQPTKEEERFRDVPKEKTITANRNIEKTREVVKTKKNKLSLLQRILNYPPNYEPEPVPVSVPVEIDYYGDE